MPDSSRAEPFSGGPPAGDDLGLLDRFAATGRERIVGGNTPVLLDRPDTAWFVASGHVEVFSVPVGAGQPAGARRHFCSADENDMLFGMTIVDPVGLLAVGVVGTRLLEISLADLRRWATDESICPAVAALVERWVTKLSEGVSRDILPRPRSDVQLDAGAESRCSPGQRVSSRKGLVWARGQDGALFLDIEGVSIDATSAFPITSDTWLTSTRASTAAVLTTEAAISTGDGWSGLDVFHATILACESVNGPLAAADELNRLHAKASRDRQISAAAVSDLASVLVPRAVETGSAHIDDPLLAACTIVGREAGIAIAAPPPRSQHAGASDPLADIAQTSRFRTRQVALRGEWWRLDAGPLLGSIEGNGRPVALVWRGGRYESHDPVSGTATPVDRAGALALSPFAQTFYRPLPDRPLGPWGLFTFATRRRGRDVWLPILMGIAGGVLGMAPAYFTGRLVDAVIPSAHRSELSQIAIILIVIAVSSLLFDIVRGRANHRLEIGLSSALQPALWDRLLSLPVGFSRRFTAGDLARRVLGVDAMRRIVSGVTLATLQTALFSVFLLLQMLYYDWRLALVALAFVVVSVAITSVTAYKKLRAVRDTAAVEGRISGLVLQLLTGIAKIRVAGAEHRAFAEWAREFALQKRLAFRMGKLDNRLAVFNSAFPIVASLGLFLTMASLSNAASPLLPRISFGDFLALNAAAGTFLLQMTQLAATVLTVLLAVPYYERAQPILETRPEVDPTKSDPGDLNGDIEISRLSFRYHEDGPLVLDDVSLSIRAGEFVAIVGPSGSGKSTLLRLLIGLETPFTGGVSYDGRDLALLDVQKLRKRLGVVMQGAHIRTGSIFENIVGALPLGMDDAWEAARLAGFDDDIRKMPMEMHTVLQQGGATLSGGQRQRLMIARAIIARPRVLLFDEATSALDNRTQAIVSRSLESLQATRIAVAHRLSTIVAADRVYVVEGGRIVQQGTYGELINQTGLFRELMRRQMA